MEQAWRRKKQLVPNHSSVARLPTDKLRNRLRRSGSLAIESASDQNESLLRCRDTYRNHRHAHRGRLNPLAPRSPVPTNSGVLAADTAEDGRPHFVTEFSPKSFRAQCYPASLRQRSAGLRRLRRMTGVESLCQATGWWIAAGPQLSSMYAQAVTSDDALLAWLASYSSCQHHVDSCEFGTPADSTQDDLGQACYPIYWTQPSRH